ncbi:Ig-like domain-containing protein [Nocardioides sp.]|uniref:beta strand repeat-containing protein n=1 Tax=Nocardioides sp. TaxID=35761 RepID=UPI0026393360|nr:Ig-like domain-containing protein [Nocardioides sp.]
MAVAGALGGLALGVLPVAGATAATTRVSCTGSGTVTAGVLTVASGETCTVSARTTLDKLVVASGGAIQAPAGYDVTLTVDGVEQGQSWSSINDIAGTLQAGTYVGSGDGGVVLSVTTQHTKASSKINFPIRQALYVDANGVDDSRSVAASWLGGTPGATKANKFAVTSTGSTFNGVWVDGATYALNQPTISLTGNGRDDFVGDGAAVVGENKANVTLDGAKITNKGVVRTGVVSDSGANVVVKNSTIDVAGGTLPSDYVANVDFDTMIASPWMLGQAGTNRATLLMGDDSKASYVNTSITAADWGALSTDKGSGVELNAINSHVATTKSGYGTYAIGSATGEYLGTDFDVVSYLSISANGSNVIHFGDSTATDVARVNTTSKLGLTAAELSALKERSPKLTSQRIGFMTWAGDNTVNVDGGTVVHTGNAIFEDKSETGTTTYNVTGTAAEAPSLTTDNGVVVQVMNQDDPGPFPPATYNDPTSVTQTASDASLANASLTARTNANLTGTSVKGDFFNGVTTAKNLVVTLNDSTVKGRISSTKAVHAGTVNEANYDRIGMVTNTVQAPVNAGVIASLTKGSTWTVTGTSYLTSLSVDATSTLRGVGGKAVTITQGSMTYTPAQLAGQTITGTASAPIVVSVADGAIASKATVSVANTTAGTAGVAKVKVVDADGEAAVGSVAVTVDGASAGTATLNASGAATVALPASIAAGRHTVKVTYAGSSAVAGTSASTTYTVAKAASATALKAAAKVRKGTRAKVTVTVSAKVKATGTVQILKGSKVIATGTLITSSAGKVTVTLPRFTKAGAVKLRAVYTGNGSVAGSSSSTVTIKVVK